MTYTPGPWTLHRGYDRYGVAGANRENVAQVMCHSGFFPGDANARLIAAAPDMLAALKTAERLMRDGIGREQVQDAIAKAEGKLR
jgi:hypothetical protein